MERGLFWALIAIVGWAPLPFGSNRPWSWSLLALLVGVLALAWAVSALSRPARIAVPLRFLLAPLVPFALVVAWTLFQASPLAPAAWTHPIWQVAGEVLGRDTRAAVSVDPAATLAALMRLLSYAGVFFLAVQLCRPRRRARQAAIALVVIGVVYAVYGLAAHLSGSNTILWFAKWAHLTSLTSSFPNRNSYATFAGLGLVLAAGLFLRALLRALGQPGDWRARGRHLLEATTGEAGVALLAVAVILTALALSLSRGGLAAAAVGIAVLLLVIPGRSVAATAPRALRVAGIAVMLAALPIVVTSGGETLERVAKTDLERELRPAAYAITLRAIDTEPLLGFGYGSFEDVFRSYQDASAPGFWTKAHNSYLENALELGVPAAALLVLSVVLAAGVCLLGVRRRRRDTLYPAVAVAASALVATHALVDYSLQIPGVAVFYAALLGLGYAQAWKQSDL